jgi:hypothetical protein
LTDRPDFGSAHFQERSMTAEQFADQVDKLIALAREGGLTNATMIVVLEDAVEALEEGMP